MFHIKAGKYSGELLRRSEARVTRLEDSAAPRVLNADQINRIAEGIKQFAGTQYVLGVLSPHPETMALLEFIEEALEEAEWKGIDCPSAPGITRRGKPIVCTGARNTGVKVGIVTAVRPPNPELVSLKDAGIALSTALWAEVIETRLEVSMGTPPPGMKTIMYIMVGPKT